MMNNNNGLDQFKIILMLFLFHDKSLCRAEFFLVGPGSGDSEYVYSPVDVNATLHCAVNSTNLQWVVGRFNFDNKHTRATLHSRRIFQSTRTSLGTTHSTLTVFGNVVDNNNTRICCLSFLEMELRENCTILIIYERPLPPEDVSVQYTGLAGLFNISWMAASVMGVDQNYTIFFKPHNVETTQLYYIHHLNIYATRCGEFLAFITVVNGAGQSDPSNNVTIPSLPNIGPVTASLGHKVWKSTGGEIMVNVSFKPAIFCVEYPLLYYLLVLRSNQFEEVISVSLNATETKVVVNSRDGLEEDCQYVYTITAVNSVGNVTTDSNQYYEIIVTSDVQSVTATIVGESTIDIQCLFIHGSDAVGCKVLLVSNCTNVKDEVTFLVRTDRFRSAAANLSLSQNISCYHRVLVYEIDVNNTVINFTIDGRINPMMDGVAKGYNQLSAIIVPTVTTMTLVVIIILVVVPLSIVLILKKKKHELPDMRTESVPSSRRGHFTETIDIEMMTNGVYGVRTGSIETTPNEVYGVSAVGIETTPNEVYGVSLKKNTPIVVYEEIPQRQRSIIPEVFPRSSEMFSNSRQFQVYEYVN